MDGNITPFLLEREVQWLIYILASGHAHASGQSACPEPPVRTATTAGFERATGDPHWVQ